MDGTQTRELTAGQLDTLQKLLAAGFQFTSIEHVTRQLPVEKNGFVALLDPADGRLKLFGQIGYRMGDGIGMLVRRGSKSAFVWKKQEVEASPELMAAYERLREEITDILEAESRA